MNFNSLNFLLFFPLVVLTYFLLPMGRIRYAMLLGASYYFYMSWNPKYVFLILASTIITYFTALWMGKASSAGKRKIYLCLSLILNLGILFIFKYFNFINTSISEITKHFNCQWGIPDFKLLLPIGISFYTFQALSYTIDVYRAKKTPEKDFLIYALYVSFFPQLVAGPIERSRRLLPQFHNHYKFDYDRITSGLKLMAWGYFQKVIIADKLAILVDTVYGNVHAYTGLSLITATVLFAFQVYCDFSGYTDIAIGSAQVMGFSLMKNFNRPYHAASVVEFWRRWHISLSTWFRDYLYIPLGGNRSSTLRHYANIMITFIAAGLWHGAAWKYAVWGAINGLYLIMSISTKTMREQLARMTGYASYKRLRKVIQIATVFILVDFSHIFFRAPTINDAFYVAANLFTDLGSHLSNILTFKFHIGMKRYEFFTVLSALALMEIVHLVQRKGEVRAFIMKSPVTLRFGLYYLFLLSLLFLMTPGSKSFIYFQF